MWPKQFLRIISWPFLEVGEQWDTSSEQTLLNIYWSDYYLDIPKYIQHSLIFSMEPGTSNINSHLDENYLIVQDYFHLFSWMGSTKQSMWPFFTRTTFMEVMSDARDRPKRDTGYSVLMWQHIPKIQLSNKVIRQRYLLTLVFSGINRSLLEVVFFTCLWTTQLIIQIEIVIFTTTTEPTTEAFEYLASKPGTMLSRQRYSVVTWQTRWLKRYNKKTHKHTGESKHTCLDSPAKKSLFFLFNGLYTFKMLWRH